MLYFPVINLFGIVTITSSFCNLALIVTCVSSANFTFKFTLVPAVVLLLPWYSTIFLTLYLLLTDFLYTSNFIDFCRLTYESFKLSVFISFISYVSTSSMSSLSVNVTLAIFAIPSEFVVGVIVSLIPLIVLSIVNFTPFNTFDFSVSVAKLTFLIFTVYKPSFPSFGTCNIIVFESEL